jgi:ech hydrogenase subunit D
MNEEMGVILIARENLVPRAVEFARLGYRIVQVLAVSKPGACELTYSFDKEGELANLRFELPADDLVVPSITEAFAAAFTYENELQDLFGIKVTGLGLDFKGEFYRKMTKAPFANDGAKKGGQ